jgi:hypothetical protein
LIKSLPLITHWLSWQPSNGCSILIALDKILGMGKTYLLSIELLLALKTHHIRYLYQANAQTS